MASLISITDLLLVLLPWNILPFFPITSSLEYPDIFKNSLDAKTIGWPEINGSVMVKLWGSSSRASRTQIEYRLLMDCSIEVPIGCCSMNIETLLDFQTRFRLIQRLIPIPCGKVGEFLGFFSFQWIKQLKPQTRERERKQKKILSLQHTNFIPTKRHNFKVREWERWRILLLVLKKMKRHSKTIGFHNIKIEEFKGPINMQLWSNWVEKNLFCENIYEVVQGYEIPIWCMNSGRGNNSKFVERREGKATAKVNHEKKKIIENGKWEGLLKD